MGLKTTIGKLLYGILFVALIPFTLVLWATCASPNLNLPVVHSTWPGIILCLAGSVVLIWGMLAIILIGKGLPMNAFPPEYLVTSSVYAVVPHPIYTGFCLLCGGISIIAKSPAGIWLVTPAVIAGCVAIVEGYEKEDLSRRFPDQRLRPFFSLPDDDRSLLTLLERLPVYILVFLTWGILYESVRILGIPRDAMSGYLAFEHSLPVLEWTEFIYFSAFVFALLVPLMLETKKDLRRFAIAGLCGTALILIFFFAIPLIAEPRPFSPQGLAGSLLLFERRNDTIAASFPSFHVFWAVLSAAAFSRRFPRFKLIWWIWAAGIAISCITTGMHAIADVVAAPAIAWATWNYSRVWDWLRTAAEKIANSWHETRLGPIRVINHGLYAGLAAFFGFLVAGLLLPASYIPSMIILSLSVLIGAALWAQYIEGSPSLLRPYGWYGGVIGAIVGSLIAYGLGSNPWLLLCAFTVSSPWIQAFGRLRCLVQGCCHGKPAPCSAGIRYVHPRSRVCRLSDLGGKPVHPTPLYSILLNAVLAVLLARLWILSFPIPLIIGIYLLVSGLGRFVEEAYRGEPQTPVKFGLRLYQWMAILSVVSGIILTCWKGDIPPTPHFSLAVLPAGLAVALITWVALGVDFPDSNRRFSRLV